MEMAHLVHEPIIFSSVLTTVVGRKMLFGPQRIFVLLFVSYLFTYLIRDHAITIENIWCITYSVYSIRLIFHSPLGIKFVPSSFKNSRFSHDFGHVYFHVEGINTANMRLSWSTIKNSISILKYFTQSLTSSSRIMMNNYNNQWHIVHNTSDIYLAIGARSKTSFEWSYGFVHLL